MFNKPTTRENTKIYRLNRSIRASYAVMFLFTLLLLPLGLFGYSINSKDGFVVDIFVYGFILSLFAGLVWLVFHVLFIFRLETSPIGGKLYGLGKVISFDWQDANRLDYAHWDKDNKFHLYLYLRKSEIRQSFTLPYKSFFPIHFSENIIPIDLLYKYVPFTSMTINRGLPTLDEQSIHLRYFIRTQLGQDLIRYAPHVFGTALSKYLPDNDLQQ